jgi:hypothetical protein
MQRKAIWVSVAVVLLVAWAAGQMQPAQEDYLDVYIAQVKPEKRADFDAIGKKIAAANRQNNGDTWLTMETVYGTENRVTFVSTRHNYAEVEKAMGAFMGAVQKAYGKPGTEKLFQDLSQCVEKERQEIRRRRWDLGSNAPSDPAAFAKIIADARWLRTTTVHVRPGQVANFEALLKEVKAARDKASPTATVLVSQAVAGQEGTVFYITALQNSLGGFDAMPALPQMLGEEGYARFLKASAETVSDTETVLNRFLPDLSNAPPQVVAAAPDFWTPKTAAAPVNAKATPIKKSVVNAKEKTKTEEMQH